MSDRLVLEDARVAIGHALAALEAQVDAMGYALSHRLEAAERRSVRMVLDQLAQKLPSWQEAASDDPEASARIEGLVERIRGLRGRRPGSACSRSSRRCTTSDKYRDSG